MSVVPTTAPEGAVTTLAVPDANFTIPDEEEKFCPVPPY